MKMNHHAYYFPPPPLFFSLQTLTAMLRSLSAALFFAIAAFFFFFVFFSLHLSRSDLIYPYTIPSPTPAVVDRHLIQSPPSTHEYSISTVAVLLPAWEVLLILSPETQLSEKDGYVCVFQNNDVSEARFAGILPSMNRTAFSCPMPRRVRWLRPFLQPVLSRKSEMINNKDHSPSLTSAPELMRWSFLVYESFSAENDVVLFAKGLNNRQGVNRPPSQFRCVFGDLSNRDAVRTAVTSSAQEVFRCQHPDFTALISSVSNTRISLEVVDGDKKKVVPSVAYYTAPTERRRSETGPTEEPSHELCACTMVYNVAKFLREWVTYHSRIGVDRFILYDNGSDDDLGDVVRQLNQEGFNVTTTFWIWPKTQEAGFSHAAVYAKSLCKWMIYIDVDEFIFAPNSWSESPAPERHMIKSLIPSNTNIGQVSIACNEFGPSNKKAHPLEGVTQGYTCRRRFEQRHKSIVRLEAVEDSLLNAIHHFDIKKEYSRKQLSVKDGVVNHYKYQAWSEFRTKFRRRVSAYVVDWTEAVNMKSKDRTPGLGFEAVEPKGWANMFCEVRDERLKMLTQRWFRSATSSMAWQS